MIEFKEGNLLKEKAEALVNAVNCVGVMGKGIALQFKQAYPDNFQAYKKACDAKQVEPGQMFVFETGNLFDPRYIINFPTKRHWRSQSKLADINAGLNSLVLEIQKRNIKSVAIPSLGCGNGGLDWVKVKPSIAEVFAQLTDVKVVIFEPASAPIGEKTKQSCK